MKAKASRPLPLKRKRRNPRRRKRRPLHLRLRLKKPWSRPQNLHLHPLLCLFRLLHLLQQPHRRRFPRSSLLRRRRPLSPFPLLLSMALPHLFLFPLSRQPNLPALTSRARDWIPRRRRQRPEQTTPLCSPSQRRRRAFSLGSLRRRQRSLKSIGLANTVSSADCRSARRHTCISS